MNSKKARRTLVCECGRKFRTSAKFNNETMCHACYDHAHEEFMEWFRKQPEEAQIEMLAIATKFCIDHGIELDGETQGEECAPVNPEEVDHADQDRINAEFAQLMEDVDL